MAFLVHFWGIKILFRLLKFYKCLFQYIFGVLKFCKILQMTFLVLFWVYNAFFSTLYFLNDEISNFFDCRFGPAPPPYTLLLFLKRIIQCNSTSVNFSSKKTYCYKISKIICFKIFFITCFINQISCIDFSLYLFNFF